MTFWTFYVDRGEGAKLRIWVTQRDPGGDPQFLIDEFFKFLMERVNPGKGEGCYPNLV